MSTKPIVLKIAFSKAQVPIFKEVKNKDWVYYGECNDFPDYLLELYSLSSKNNAIINSKASYIYANGFEYDTSKVPAEQRSNYERFYKHINPEEDLNSLFRKINLDREIFGGFAVEVIPNRTKNGVAAFYHVDFSKIRSNDNATEFYYCDNWFTKKDGKTWANNNPQKEKSFKVYPKFEKQDVYDSDRYLIYFKSYRPNLQVYPLPDYMGACSAIDTDIRITNFHLNNIKNGFFASKIINFNNGLPEPEQQDSLEASIKDKFTGDENAGKFVLFFNDGQDRAATVLDLTAGDLDKQFEQLRKNTDQEIFIGHRITSPMLFGVRVEGQLGGRNELLEAFELFKNGYVNDAQSVFEDFFNKLAELKGLSPVFEITETAPLENIVELSEQTIVSALTKEEIRELIIKQTGLKLKPAISTSGTPTPQEDTVEIQLNDEKDIPIFLKYGHTKDKFERVYARPLNFNRNIHETETELKFARLQFDDKFTELTKSERQILDKIAGGKGQNIEAKTLKKLRDKNLVEVKQDSGKIALTDLGELAIADIPEMTDRKLSQLRVVYEYTLRPDTSGAEVIPTTRPFCKALVESNKYFSREDITRISDEVGYDVWKYRGGWITLASGEHRPSCRHIWQQVLVQEII